MNILFLSHSGKRSGGAQNVLFSLLESLPKDRYTCHCLFPEPGEFLDALKTIGIPTYIVKFKWWAGFEMDTVYKIIDCLLNFRTSVDPIVEIIKSNKIDLVVSNTVTMAEGALAARVAGIPHIWYIHEILSRDPKLKHMMRLEFLYPVMLILSKALIVVSNEVKLEIENHLGYSSSKIHVVYNGVKSGAPDFVRKHNNVVISAGGICRRKGQMVLLKAARLVCNEIPDALFYTAGKFWEKQYRTDLVEERVRLGMEKKFHFMKWIHDMDTFYRSGAIFASASTCEAFGLVLLEAMNNGLPVVTTNSGGPSEIVVDGSTGYLIPVDDVEGLAGKIVHILKNPDIGDKMGINGYHRVKELFSHEAFIEKMDEILTMGGTCGIS